MIQVEKNRSIYVLQLTKGNNIANTVKSAVVIFTPFTYT